MSEQRPATLEHETRADGSMVLRGHAALYDTPTDIGGMFTEVIQRGAFDGALQRGDDVRALLNHDPNMVLGRTKAGTLRLWLDDRGLAYEVDLDAENDVSRRVWRMVQRGDVSQSSFAFTVPAGGAKFEPAASREVLPRRVITNVELYDVSPVTYPAYAETTVSARDLPRAVVDAETDAIDALRLRHLSARLAAYQDV